VNFFCSVEHLREWAVTVPRAGRLVALTEAATAGARLWASMR
jgi:hypothetical protein